MRPQFIYGTAWKEARTAELTRLALAVGFRAFDTANQRKHYVEAAVGEALAEALDDGLERDALFVQTKFTFARGQDHRLPYDPRAPIQEQVRASLASSLEHLAIGWLDAYVLHGPSQAVGLTDADHEAWSAMERAHDAGLVRALGVSNVSGDQLDQLWDAARIKPMFAQIRAYAARGWAAEQREVAARRGLMVQGFSLLTANPGAWRGAALEIARARGVTPAQVIYAFARQLRMVPLTGTTDEHHMAQALGSLALELSPGEMERMSREVG